MIHMISHIQHRYFFVLVFLSTTSLLQSTPKTTTATEQALVFENEILVYSPEHTRAPQNKISEKKPWTIIIYMAADNDLRNFATRNLKQMSSIGSTEHINIVVHLDIRMSGNVKTTRRYVIEKDKVLHVNPNESETQLMDSGDPATLISCCEWAIRDYPAHEYALIFWNHGAGIIDPERGRIINPAELFNFNPNINKLELDRSVAFLDLVSNTQQDQRGICWDETTGNYLNNQKLEFALKKICTNFLDGKKLSIIGFDACLMSMLEVGNLVQPYAHIMVASQEVELGTGWNYAHVLYPFIQQTLTKLEFATHIVHMYEKTYKSVTYDYTQSAINLDAMAALEQSVHEVSTILLEAMPHQTHNSIKNTIKEARKKNNCTHFDEPSYIDLHHLFSNIINQIPSMTLQNSKHEQEFKQKLKDALEISLRCINNAVIANVCGKNLQQAAGVSIYFPERRTHPSYLLTRFAQSNNWARLIGQFVDLHRDVCIGLLDSFN
jgi:hypothetical protein